MSERHPIDDRGQRPAPEEAEVVERLLRLAGPREGPPPEAARRVREAVRSRWIEVLRARRRRRARVWIAGSVAAAAMIVLAVSTTLRRDAPPAPAPTPPGTLILAAGSVRDAAGARIGAGDRLDAGAVVATDPDARAALRLAGGPVVRLDTDTRVRLEGGPVVTLDRGAIYVDTGPDGATRDAVVVRTGAGLIREVGTRFEVRLRDGSLRVRVRQGSVQFDRAGRTHAVGGGGQITLDRDGEPRIGAAPGHGPDWDWVLAASPEFSLEGRTLGAFLDWVSSETGLTVVFSPGIEAREASAIVLHGSVAGLRPDLAPAAVLPTCGLDHEIAGGVLTILRAPTGHPHP